MFATGSNVNVSKCHVRNATIDGISIAGGAVVISGNTVTACGGNGIIYLRSAIGDSLIEKNTCTQNGFDGIAAIGDGLTLSKNHCELNGERGILVQVQALRSDGAPASPPVDVEKNTCLDNDVGLFLLNGTVSAVTISKNDCSNNADRGIIVDAIEPVITSNSCEDNGGIGMHLLTGGAQASKNVCSGNRQSGILVEAAVADGGGFGSGSDNVLGSNTCKDNGGDGIQLLDGSQNSCDGNKCLGNGDDGIDLDDASITNATVSGNTCNENGHEGIDNSGQATVITDNVCKNNGYGIGPDIGGTGDEGAGTVAAFTGNKFGTGGDTTTSRLDNYAETEP
jgi:parallel beta-helix repeat protein